MDGMLTMFSESQNQRSKFFVLTPFQLVLVMAMAIFVTETGVMFLLDYLPPLSHGWEAVIDSSTLLLLLCPVYFLVYLPFWRERRRYEREIRHLSRRLLSTVEDERRRIAHELHDECGQTLTALQFGMQTLRKTLPGIPFEHLGQMDNLVKLIAKLGNELREVTSKLRPAALDEVGLFAALRSLTDDFARSYPDLKVDLRLFRETDLKKPLSPEREVAIFRICQEALTNVIRHSAAKRVRVSLAKKEEAGLRVEVADDGCGFDLNHYWRKEADRQGIGLLGMRERAAASGGTFEIFSEVNRGTCVIVEYPFVEDSYCGTDQSSDCR